MFPDKSDTDLFGAEQDAFEVWWLLYPHKVGKAEAKRKFPAALKRAGSFAVLTDGLGRYMRTKPERISWCNPATWLYQDRWLDGLSDKSQAVRQAASDQDLTPLAKAMVPMIGLPAVMSWINGLEALRDGERAVIAAKSAFIRDWIASHYEPQLLRALGVVSIAFEIKRKDPQAVKPGGQSVASRSVETAPTSL